MITEISIKEALSSGLPILDVRSPGEFKKGHIPNAFNIPLFTDKERARVGTVYKQESKEAAIELGYTYVNPKLDHFISESRKLASTGRLVVHCWRGGMRSQSFAKHLAKNRFNEVSVIMGGYKSYRNLVLNELANPIPIRVLGGYTGSGKTRILNELKNRQEQVIDFEGLAHHKGSAFGAIGQKNQPTVEQFENNLFHLVKQLDTNKPVWVEDESHSIGKVRIPVPFYIQMKSAKLYFIDIPREERAKYLAKEYGVLDKSKLEEAIQKITKRLGGLRTKEAIEKLKNNDFFGVALLLLQYYDKTYHKALTKRNHINVQEIWLEGTNYVKNAKIIMELVHKTD